MWQRLTSSIDANTAGVKVWDLPTRLFHWSLAALVAICLLTGYSGAPALFSLHIACGTGVAGLLAFRLVWGFIGPYHARFRNFLHGPKALLEHLLGLLVGRPPRHLGHNPAGSWMIFALLGTLTLIVLAGFVAIGGTEKTGPFAGFVPYVFGKGAKEIHEGLAALLGFLVAGHVAGVVLESKLLGENLAAAMVHGHRRLCGRAEAAVSADTSGDAEAEARAGLLRLLPAFFAGLAVSVLAGMTLYQVPDSDDADDARAVGKSAWPAVYASECGDCHTPYHPSLLPPESWRRILARLDDHFGEDASLDSKSLAAIRRFLLVRPARNWDTKPAHELRFGDGRVPLRMTETPFWKRKHRRITRAIFTSPAVGGKANCASCHRDADTGLFRRTAIAIPKAALKTN